MRPFPQKGQGTVVFAAPDFNLDAEQRQSEVKALLASPLTPASSYHNSNRSLDTRSLKWGHLPASEQEATDIAELLEKTRFGPVKAYIGNKALEEIFKSLHSPRILHIATHGFFLPDQPIDPEERDLPIGPGATGAAHGLAILRGVENPLLRSGIVLAGANTLGQDPGSHSVDDGWVTAEEIAMMDLKGTDLVVLSACDTGLGDVKNGEGVYGLRKAFQFAGARSLVASLFRVPDEPTRELMRSFYKGLLAGKSKLAALRDAQLQIIAERRAAFRAAHPFFWASFILVGAPD